MSEDGVPEPDNLALSRKEDFKAFAEGPRRSRPDLLTPKQLKCLTTQARADYDRQRRKWHANIGPVKTPQLAELHEDLWDIVDSNEQDGDKAKGAVAVDAFPGLGKTTTVLAFARDFHQREIEESGPFTSQGHERIPVCRVGLTGNTGMKDLNRAMLEFFGHPGVGRGTTAQFGRRVLDCVLSCEVRLLVLDDLHFLKWGQRSGIEVSNHLKWIANEFPVTLLMVGVELAEKGLFGEGTNGRDTALAQTGRRTTRLGLRPFTIDAEAGRREWRQMLLALEQRVVLTDKHPGMLADDLSDYLFARSTGHIGSLMTLINRGCQRAVRTGAERLDQTLMDRVKNDEASEAARLELQAALDRRHAAGRHPEGPRGGGSHNTALRVTEQAARTPAILREALTSPYAWQRIERFVAASRYPTMREAAAALGINQPTLVTQINRLERDLGQALLERAERGRVMKLTPFGQTVMAAASTVIIDR